MVKSEQKETGKSIEPAGTELDSWTTTRIQYDENRWLNLSSENVAIPMLAPGGLLCVWGAMLCIPVCFSIALTYSAKEIKTKLNRSGMHNMAPRYRTLRRGVRGKKIQLLVLR